MNLDDVVADALAIIKPLADRRRQVIAVTEPPRLTKVLKKSSGNRITPNAQRIAG